MISTNSKKSNQNISNNNISKFHNFKRPKSSKKNIINKNVLSNQKVNNQNLKKNKRDKTPKKNSSKSKTKNKNINISDQNDYLNDNNNYINNPENLNYINPIILGELNSLRSDFSDLNIKNNNNQFYYNNQENDINQINIQKNKELLNKINESIFNLERIIPELTRDYKNIVTRINSNLFPEENLSLQNNLKLISNEIENNSLQLNELKSQQQELLKYILSQGGNVK